MTSDPLGCHSDHIETTLKSKPFRHLKMIHSKERNFGTILVYFVISL